MTSGAAFFFVETTLLHPNDPTRIRRRAIRSASPFALVPGAAVLLPPLCRRSALFVLNPKKHFVKTPKPPAPVPYIAMQLPPLHPAIVHFPIALITLAVIADFIGYFRQSANARTVAWWSLVGALIGGSITVLFGYLDMWRAALTPATHELIHVHLKVGWVIAVLLLLLTIWRWRLRANALANPTTARPIGGGYLACAALLLFLTLFQGWFGGEIAYAHGAGSAAAGQGVRPLSEAQRPAKAVADALSHLPFMGHDESKAQGGKSSHAHQQ